MAFKKSSRVLALHLHETQARPSLGPSPVMRELQDVSLQGPRRCPREHQRDSSELDIRGEEHPARFSPVNRALDHQDTRSFIRVLSNQGALISAFRVKDSNRRTIRKETLKRGHTVQIRVEVVEEEVAVAALLPAAEVADQVAPGGRTHFWRVR